MNEEYKEELKTLEEITASLETAPMKHFVKWLREDVIASIERTANATDEELPRAVAELRANLGLYQKISKAESVMEALKKIVD